MRLNRTLPTILAAVGLLAVVGMVTLAARTDAEPVPMTAYMTPECGCCGDWVSHMKANGFLVTTRSIPGPDLDSLKDRVHVPANARSCHTAEVKGYVVEGHVPAESVHRMVKDGPEILGLAVPGMPFGSPGMEVPDVEPTPYDVLAFDASGELAVMESRPGPEGR